MANIINMISGDLLSRDSSTSYDMSKGTQSFESKYSTNNGFVIQLVWESLSHNNAVVEVYGSNDNLNYDLLTGTSSKTLNSANGSYSFIKDAFNWEYISVKVTVNSVVTGTLKVNINIK